MFEIIGKIQDRHPELVSGKILDRHPELVSGSNNRTGARDAGCSILDT
jgi:hypothetical protein